MIAAVLVEVTNKNVDKLFDYLVPSSLESEIQIGIRVEVPFATRTLEGFVLEIKNSSEAKNLKEIKRVIDEKSILNKELLELGKWMANDTLSSLINCYQVMLPKALKAQAGTNIGKKYEKVYYYHPEVEVKLNKSQEEVVAAFQKKNLLSRSELHDFSKARLDRLVEKGVLEERLVEAYRLEQEEEKAVRYSLTVEQQKAVDTMIQTDKTVSLLHGVTGSGKTEVYMELIAHALKEGKQSIVLVPEISLTPQMIKRFKQRFGNQIALWHSALSEGEKYDEWRKMARGEVNIVIGARSAVFAPLQHIGFIILDEEHSDSYKQDSSPRYDTKQVAIQRALYHGGKVILGSATPLLETYARAKKNVYQLVELPHRINGKALPRVEVIDMNQEIRKAKGHFSLPLIEAMKNRLEKHEQIILLLNRRGYASVITCHQCGYVENKDNYQYQVVRLYE